MEALLQYWAWLKKPKTRRTAVGAVDDDLGKGRGDLHIADTDEENVDNDIPHE